MTLLAANSRTPDKLMGDLRALLGAPELLAGDYGAWLNLSAVGAWIAARRPREAGHVRGGEMGWVRGFEPPIFRATT